MQEFSIGDYLYLFEQLNILSKANPINCARSPEEYFLKPIGELKNHAERLGYPATTAHLSNALRYVRLDNFHLTFSSAKASVESALATFAYESRLTNVTILNDSAVAERLKDIEPRLPESGKLFFQETVYCLRIEAFRATIVNAWAMCMDYIQEWIVTDSARLQGFNTALSVYSQIKKDSSGNVTSEKRIYDDIAEKSDFWESRKPPSERVVLDCVGQTVGERLHRKMVAALDDRNQFAHANSSQLDLDKTKGYISSILDIIEHPKLQ